MRYRRARVAGSGLPAKNRLRAVVKTVLLPGVAAWAKRVMEEWNLRVSG